MKPSIVSKILFENPQNNLLKMSIKNVIDLNNEELLFIALKNRKIDYSLFEGLSLELIIELLIETHNYEVSKIA